MALPAALPVAAAQEVRFDVLEFQIEGNTVLDVTRIEQVVTPFPGPWSTLHQEAGLQTRQPM